MKRALWCVVVLFVACTPSQESATIRTDPPRAADEDQDVPRPTEEIDMDKPKIAKPEGDPPKELVIDDIEEGDGAEAEAGATVTIHYLGVSWSSGKEFDSSWSRGAPATFPLDRLIQGWQQGIPGMKEGGRRRLTIPPRLAYGDSPPPGIEPGETLVFVIDLIDADAA